MRVSLRVQATIVGEMFEQLLRYPRGISPAAPKLVLVAATLLLMPMAPSGHLVTGSLVVLNSSDDYIAIAADGKGVSQKGASYDRCKIVALDNRLIYTATGYTSRADGSQIGGTWVASALAKQMYRSLAKNPRHELIPKLAEALGASLASRLNQSVEAHPQEAWPPVLVTALFAGFDENGKRIIIQVDAMRTDERHVGYTARLVPDDVHAVLSGETAVAEEYTAGRTTRSQSWQKSMAFENAGLGVREQLIHGAEKIVTLTEQYDPTLVGGPIDTVVISREAGVIWIHRKPECAKGFGR
jgi:hypothetical protein